MQQTNSTVSTKRKVLATTASIFDPLGLLSPAVIAYKIFLQKLWQNKLQWDEPLPAHLQQEWNYLLQTIPKLSQLKVNRKVICSNAVNVQLHGFCEAVKELMEPASTCSPQTVTTRHFVKFCVPHRRWHH